MILLLPLLGAGCVSSQVPDRFLVVDRQDGEYGTFARAMPALTDPRHMDGELGRGFRGGFFRISLLSEDLDVEYVEGGAIDLRYVVRDGMGVPLDEDGLILWTYYHTLAAARGQLTEAGIDLSGIFPINFAYQPIFVTEDFFSGENAAYVSGGVHMFMLLPDMVEEVIPLAANPGVIRHEFGHALFHAVTVGDPKASAPYDSLDDDTSSSVSALDEGFADMLATLTLDDPNFFVISIPSMQSRDVTGDWQASPALYPSGDPLNFDPYALGTVYASLAWDLRERTSPETALEHVIGALEDWAAEEAWSAPDRWAELLVEHAYADSASLGLSMCDAYAFRFPDNTAPEPCG
ncbi:MAG: hypothetical protein H6739_21165 [Alphaproteobacteria bacterium]|nr:hypothetical protein [Alphaproteobacteria bacterium]